MSRLGKLQKQIEDTRLKEKLYGSVWGGGQIGKEMEGAGGTVKMSSIFLWTVRCTDESLTSVFPWQYFSFLH